MPMAFCFPGSGKSGDLPPRKECAPQWHQKMLEGMPDIKLTILIGAHACKYYLEDLCGRTLTELIRKRDRSQSNRFILPHPSPRNNIWQAKNKWFKTNIVPQLRTVVRKAIR
jgi:uracil-DNA glycosylase